MNIVIAPDSFKESLTSIEVAEAIEKGWKEEDSQCTFVKVPLADGGEGTVSSLVHATNGKIYQKEVTGPLGERVKATYGILGDGKTAVIEMAEASGLHLVPLDKRNPLVTTTYGTGELILAALQHNVDKVILGIGGSATNDGGAGMAQALGVKLLNEKQRQIKWGGGQLHLIRSIDFSNLHPSLLKVDMEIACDVTNPLTGPTGASAIYGPQKGADEEMVSSLDRNLTHFGDLIESHLNISVMDVAGAGAAGGLGAGLLAFCSAKLIPGIEMIIKATKLEEKIMLADLVITGEGKIDGQTAFGKTPVGVARLAKKYKKPVIAIAGSLQMDGDDLYDEGMDALFSITPSAMSLDEALEDAYENTFVLSKNIARLWKIARNS
ncbi:glycerate kinase [Salipaludibacillus daqingensis]|uniref:glycerate kinase n=1 Tax=Salipaludibacillus daqingensis TaxID=3041001 RepID=UPI0024732813|nr:glycerate kinase [Salipaludibacillus daqingensis]